MKKMKQFSVAGLLVVMVFALSHGAAVAGMPRDYQDFKARFEKEARTEQGAVHLFFEAIYSYLNENTRADASKMLRYMLYDAQPIERMHTRAVFVERMKKPSDHYIFRSYAVGATPENNYSMSPDNFELEFVRRQVDPNGDITLYILNGGTDSPRPIQIRKYDGLWHIRGFSSIYTQVRAPKATVDARRRAIDADNDIEGQWDTPAEVEDEPQYEESAGGFDFRDDADEIADDVWK